MTKSQKIFVLGFMLLGGVLLPRGLWAAAVPSSSETSLADEKEPDTSVSHAVVSLDGKFVANVSGVPSFPAEKRARLIEGRLIAIAKDPSISTNSIHLAVESDRIRISAGDRLIMNVIGLDTAGKNLSQEFTAEVAKNAIVEAVVSYRHVRSGPRMVLNVLSASGATLLFALFISLLFWVSKKMNFLLSSRIQTYMETIQSKSFHLIQAERLNAVFYSLTRTVFLLLAIVAGIFYLQFVLSCFPWTYAVSHQLLALLTRPIKSVVLVFVAKIPDLAFLAVLGFITTYTLKLIRLFFSGVDHGTIRLKNFDSEWAWPTYRIVRIVVVAFACVVAYPYIPGSSSDAFKGISIFLGVLFSLGSSSFISNIIAGYSVTYRRAFKVGDRVKIGDLVGDVEEVRLMVTRLKSLKNEEITIPNSSIINSHVLNYSARAKENPLILYTTVGIGYETPWRQVDAMLRLAADKTDALLKTPPPFILIKSLGDFAVNYELNVYCGVPNRMMAAYTALHKNILDIFNEHGVQIMTPAYEGDPEVPKVVPKDQWFAAPAKKP